MDTGLSNGIPALFIYELLIIDAAGATLARIWPAELVSENPVPWSWTACSASPRSPVATTTATRCWELCVEPLDLASKAPLVTGGDAMSPET
jgi:hypothetical protein